jgi:hypothetical protein
MAQVVEQFLNKHEALISNLSKAKNTMPLCFYDPFILVETLHRISKAEV